MKLTQDELNLRLANLKCCIATLSNELLNKIKIDSKDVECKLKDLQMLQGFYESIKCYNVLQNEVLATGTIIINSLSINTNIQVFIGSIPISSVINVAHNSISTVLTSLVTSINSYQKDYVAVKNNLTLEITNCKNGILTVSADDVISTTITNLVGGVCKVTNDNNCLLETEVKQILDLSATKCKNCFSLTI